MSKSGMNIGIDKKTWTCNMIIDKSHEKFLKAIQTEVKESSKILFATDPDREGESISYYLAKYLNIDLNNKNRIVFNEITKERILEAIENPTKININLVNAQIARRIIDRIIGFKTSLFLQQKIKSRSAGRVQSVVLNFIKNKEGEILDFKSKIFWEIKINLKNTIDTFFYLKKINSQNIEKIEQENKKNDILIDLKNSKSVKLDLIKKTTKNTKVPKPLNTSGLIRIAYNHLNFSPKKTMLIAQNLFEGIKIKNKLTALISYIRTDSYRYSDIFIKNALNEMKVNYDKKFINFNYKNISNKSNISVQDAHEAIRPTYINIKPESIKDYLSKDGFKLYNLIYYHTLATLSMSACFLNTKLEFVVKNKNNYAFANSASTITNEGYLKFTNKYNVLKQLNEVNIFESNEWKKDNNYEINKIIDIEKHTTPPKRYSFSSIIKLMEKNDIGRPSTYVPTLNKLVEHSYVYEKNKSLHPTTRGYLTSNIISEYFSQFINEEFTKLMENKLDLIAHDQLDKNSYLKEVDNNVINLLNDAIEKNKNKIIFLDSKLKCPKCKTGNLILLKKFSDFFGCSNFFNKDVTKKCDFSCPTTNFKTIILDDLKCEKCNSNMKICLSKKKFTLFIICSGFSKM